MREMAKKHKATPKLDVSKHVTKRRLARWEQERRKRRIYTTIGVLIIATVVLIVVLAFATNTTPEEEWVTMVGDTRFYGPDYADALYLCQLGFFTTSGNESEDTLVILETTEIIRQGAAEARIPVTDNEITEQIRFMFETENKSLTEFEFQEAYQQLLSSTGLSNEEFRDVVTTGILQVKMELYLREQIPNSTEHVYIEALLLNSSEDAPAIAERLNSGENFSSLAEDYQYQSLGWLPRGVINPEIEEVAFSLDSGEVSDLIYITDPNSELDIYYILKVSGKEERVMDESINQMLKENAFPGWLAMQRENKVERNPNFDLDALYEWALEQIAERRS